MQNKVTIEVPKVKFNADGNLEIKASPSSSKQDFDFFQGKWQLTNRKLKSRLNNCEEWIEFDSTQEMYSILDGIGNIDNFFATFDGEPFEGMSLRLFNPKTKLWTIYWADSNEGILQPGVSGSFENNIAHFFTKDIFNGKEMVVVFRWDVRDKKIQFGVRHFLKIREKVGNGIGLCISKNFVTNYLVKLDRIIICSDAITLLDLTPLILKTNNH